jgi:hypothetical protein
MVSQSHCGLHSQTSVKILATCCILFLSATRTLANDGQPVGIRYWPDNSVSIETMWNFHIALGVTAQSRRLLPREADVEFLDDFWEATDSDKLVLDRKPNEPRAVLSPGATNATPSDNAVVFSKVILTSASTGKSMSLNAIQVDGVTIVDGHKNRVDGLTAILQELRELPASIKSIDAFLIDDVSADSDAYEALQKMLKARVMILRKAVKFDTIGGVAVTSIPHNTFAIAKTTAPSKTTWVKLSEEAWTMESMLAGLFQQKEFACGSSRAVFAELTVNQMNFRPSNGTHTPRWNAEHMMGRELLFFSQIYHAANPAIPVMDLNPKQMPADYQAAHPDWTGLEESLQMERVEAFTRRFAYLLEGMDLDKTAKGSSFWTPRRLLRQMDVHYTEHTANVVKKKALPEWPKD